MKSKRSKATDITKRTKERVFARDGGKCIFCGSSQAAPNAHLIPRSHGGLGTEKNIITLCFDCHRRMDQTTERQQLCARAEAYLRSKYRDWNKDELVYDKWAFFTKGGER